MTPKSEYVLAMSTFFWYAAPIAVIALTFALRPLRAWLESCAREATAQGELVEAYQHHVSRFLKLSDPVKHAEVREIVVWAGRNMLDGTKLIRFIITNGRRVDTDADVHRKTDRSLEGLSDEARHAFGRALGSALLASSYQSAIWGRMYRAMLLWVLKVPDREVKEPEQIVYRYRRANSLDNHKRGLMRA